MNNTHKSNFDTYNKPKYAFIIVEESQNSSFTSSMLRNTQRKKPKISNLRTCIKLTRDSIIRTIITSNIYVTTVASNHTLGLIASKHYLKKLQP